MVRMSVPHKITVNLIADDRYIMPFADLTHCQQFLLRPDTSYRILIEMPAILCDLAIAFIIYKWASKKYNKSSGLLLAMLALFMPAVIMDSCGWGQIDSVFTLATILCL